MPASRIEISISEQKLWLFNSTEKVWTREFLVSTAANGAGERSGSECTPRGQHRIRAKIGAGQPAGAVFVGRRPTGEIWSPQLATVGPKRDWILTRILWLAGTEAGFNRFGECSTQPRYIYIHGTPDTTKLGAPGSHGCVRMNNQDLIELFDLVEVGTPVTIAE